MSDDAQAEVDAAAVAYAEHGWPVVQLHGIVDGHCTCSRPEQCKSPGKHPSSRNGLDDATTDVRTVRRWFDGRPRNVGLLCGVAFDVLDVDGTDAQDVLLDEQARHGTLPFGPRAQTGRPGGLHIFFRPNAAYPRANKHHLDWRGPGSYIVAAPSLHVSGRRYRWLTGFDHELPTAPKWLVELVNPPRTPMDRSTLHMDNTVRNPKRYARRALERACDEVANAPQGMRNDTLNACCFKMRRFIEYGQLSAYDVVESMLDAAIRAGLGERESVRTIRSALGL